MNCLDGVYPFIYGTPSKDGIFFLSILNQALKNHSGKYQSEHYQLPLKFTTIDGEKVKTPSFIINTIIDDNYFETIADPKIIIIALEKNNPNSRLNILQKYIRAIIAARNDLNWTAERLDYGIFHISAKKSLDDKTQPLIIFEPQGKHHDIANYVLPFWQYLTTGISKNLIVLTPHLKGKLADIFFFNGAPIKINGNRSLMSINRNLMAETVFDILTRDLTHISYFTGASYEIKNRIMENFTSLLYSDKPQVYDAKAMIKRIKGQLGNLMEEISITAVNKLRQGVKSSSLTNLYSDMQTIKHQLDSLQDQLQYKLSYIHIGFGLGMLETDKNIIDFLNDPTGASHVGANKVNTDFIRLLLDKLK